MKEGHTQINDKPTIGFLPNFYTLGETVPLVKIAKKYALKGGKIIFFSHGGFYEEYAKKAGFEVIKLTDLGYVDKLLKIRSSSNISVEKFHFIIYNEKTILEHTESEINAFKKYGIDLVFVGFTPTCSISARALKIPLIILISGTSSPPYYRSDNPTFPDNYENFATKIIPSFIKNRIIKWFLLNNKMFVKDFNKVVKKYNLKFFKTLNDILLGDYTLICDDINFLGLKPSKDFPLENYIGPIFGIDTDPEENKEIENKIYSHLNRPGRTILISLGSSALREFYLKILETLNQTDYNVIAICTTRFDINNFPKFNENILQVQYVNSISKLSKKVDLLITHGGRGTIYNAAYSGKPAICLPLFFEQQYNVDCLVKKGVAIRLSSKYFRQKDLLKAIDKIFKNYDKYSKNAVNLTKMLSKENGEDKAVDRIIKIIEETKNKKLNYN